MNYPESTTQWKRGDIVIHETDAKKQLMLLKIVLALPGSMYCCKYIYHKEIPTTPHRKFHISELHDPRKFGIIIPNEVG